MTTTLKTYIDAIPPTIPKGALASMNTIDLASSEVTGILPASHLPPTSFPVTTVFGRTGSVTAASGDYSISQISGAGALASLSSVDLSGTQATGTLAAARMPAFTGDATNAAGSLVLTLATVNSNVGTFQGVTLNAKGLVTGASNLAGVANGLATLDGAGKIPPSQIPSSIVNGLEFAGLWNASSNTPMLASGAGTKGFVYKVSVAGTTPLDGISQWYPGDFAFFDGTTWDKVDGLASEVFSVAGRTGAVTLSAGDISGLAASATTNTTTTANITDSTNRRFVTDAQLAVIGNTTGTNTGDQANITGNAGTVTTINGLIAAGTNVTLTGSGTAASPYTITSTASSSPVATVTTNTTLDQTYGTILVDASAGPVSLTLPSGSGYVSKIYRVKKIDATSNAVTLVGTVDGQANYSTSIQYDFVAVQSNGTSWYIIA